MSLSLLNASFQEQEESARARRRTGKGTRRRRLTNSFLDSFMTIPHLVPRLLHRLKSAPRPQALRPVHPRARRRRSLRSPLPDDPDFTSVRKSSILLDPINPISTSRSYVRHKSLPPKVEPPQDSVESSANCHGIVEHDAPRKMTMQEKDWFANPYRAPTPIYYVYIF